MTDRLLNIDVLDVAYLKGEFSEAMRKRLPSLEESVKNTLLEYILILLTNKRTFSAMVKELNTFFEGKKDNAKEFVEWIWQTLGNKVSEAEAANSTSIEKTESQPHKPRRKLTTRYRPGAPNDLPSSVNLKSPRRLAKRSLRAVAVLKDDQTIKTKRFKICTKPSPPHEPPESDFIPPPPPPRKVSKLKRKKPGRGEEAETEPPRKKPSNRVVSSTGSNENGLVMALTTEPKKTINYVTEPSLALKKRLDAVFGPAQPPKSKKNPESNKTGNSLNVIITPSTTNIFADDQPTPQPEDNSALLLEALNEVSEIVPKRIFEVSVKKPEDRDVEVIVDMKGIRLLEKELEEESRPKQVLRRNLTPPPVSVGNLQSHHIVFDSSSQLGRPYQSPSSYLWRDQSSGQGNWAEEPTSQEVVIVDDDDDEDVVIITNKKDVFVGPDFNICWDFFSPLGCLKEKCTWKHAQPVNKNAKYKVLKKKTKEYNTALKEDKLRRVKNPLNIPSQRYAKWKSGPPPPPKPSNPSPRFFGSSNKWTAAPVDNVVRYPVSPNLSCWYGLGCYKRPYCPFWHPGDSRITTNANRPPNKNIAKSFNNIIEDSNRPIPSYAPRSKEDKESKKDVHSQLISGSGAKSKADKSKQSTGADDDEEIPADFPPVDLP